MRDKLTGRATELGTRFLPGVTLGLWLTALLSLWDVSMWDIARYSAYFASCVAAPGVLIWRALGPSLMFRVDELAMGTALGYALETVSRIAVTLARVPPDRGVASAWIVVAVIAVHPRLRARWRVRAKPLPLGVAWAYTATLSLILAWFALTVYSRQPVVWQGGGGPENDLLFALALAGEAAHRWPLDFPWVAGEPLVYHWFFAEHLAAARTVSQVDLSVLLLRLDLLPTVILTALTTGALAVRLSRRVWAGPLSVALLFIVQDLSPVPWGQFATSQLSNVAGVPFNTSLWWSTSGGYAAVVFAPLALLLIDLTRRALSGGQWTLLALLAIVGTGAKASVLPVAVAGMSCVLGCLALRPRRSGWRWRPIAAAIGLMASVFVTSWILLYERQSQLLEFAPVRFVMTTALGSSVLGEGVPGRSVSTAIGVLGLCVLATAPSWVGCLLLVPVSGREPAFQFIMGAALLGLAAMTLLYHEGQSNLYFLRTALPLMAAASAWGLMRSFSSSFRQTRFRAGALFSGLCGTAVSALVSQGDWFTFEIGQPAPDRLARAAFPFSMIIMGAAATGLVAYAVNWTSRGGFRSRLHGSAASGVVFLLGAACLQVPSQAGVLASRNSLGAGVDQANPGQRIDGDSVGAARWLRDHSSPDELVLTNVLCANGPLNDVEMCDNRSFWVAAYTERRTYLSGWGYTATANRLAADSGVATWQVPFWDQAKLGSVRTFLAEPDAASAHNLAARGVKWVVVSPGFEQVSPRLADFATLRHRVGMASVYELTGEPPHL